jgi:hypothetical protein
VVGPTFETDYGLYEAGTIVFVGMILSLQAKVAFYHHQWSYPQILSMLISLFIMFFGYIVLTLGVNDYYYDAIVAYNQPIFWFYGCFSMPLFTMMIDWIGYYTKMFFFPTKEMLYRELDLQEQKVSVS